MFRLHPSSPVCAQLQLNYLGNYVPTAWTFENGCSICDDDLLFLNDVPVRRRSASFLTLNSGALTVCVCVQDEEMPLVYVGVFIERATPFMDEFLHRLTTINYPTARIRLFIHNNVRLSASRYPFRLFAPF